MTTQLYDAYLNKHTIRGEINDEITNTRIGDKTLQIFGGKYHFNAEDYKKFISSLYLPTIILSNKEEFLTEKQLPSGGALVLDLDFRFDYTQQSRIITADHLENLIIAIADTLKSIYQLNDEPFPVFILQKPHVNPVKEKKVTKDGIHVIIGIQGNPEVNLYLRNQLIEKCKEGELFQDIPFTNKWEDIFDIGIAKGTTNMQLIGSRKPNNEAYELTKCVYIHRDPTDGELCFPTEGNLEGYYTADKIMQLSVRYTEHKQYSYNTTYKNNKTANIVGVANNKLIINRDNDKQTTNEYIQKYIDYASLINPQCYDDYSTWYNFQRASSNLHIPFDVYDGFVSKGSERHYDEENNKVAYEKPPSDKKEQLGWNFIKELAKECNPEGKASVDEKYGSSTFCKFKFMKIKADGNPAEIDKLQKEWDALKTSGTCSKEIDAGFEKKMKEAVKTAEKETEKQTYEKRKVYFEKFHFKLLSPFCYARTKEDGYDLMTECLLKGLHKNLGGFIDEWIKDINIKEYELCDFCPPPEQMKRGTFNIYTGLEGDKLLKDMHADINVDEIAIFLKHLWYLSGKNNKVLTYIVNYLSHMVQLTGELPRTAIVFKSVQGCGKNIFFENFAEKLLGAKYLLATANLDNILGRFPMINQKLLILMDEANGKDSFLENDKIKNFITAKSLPFEKKGIDAIDIKNCGRMLFFTNNEYPVKIEQSDRRFVVVECSPDIKNNTAYFKALINAFNDKNKVAMLFKFLKTRDISKFDPTNDRPITALYKEIQTATIPLEQKFFLDKSKFEWDDEKVHFSKDEIYDLYKHWCVSNKFKYNTELTYLKRLKNYSFITNERKTGDDGRKTVKYTIHTNLLQEWADKNDTGILEEDPIDQFPDSSYWTG
jgi:hypothetical protein